MRARRSVSSWARLASGATGPVPGRAMASRDNLLCRDTVARRYIGSVSAASGQRVHERSPAPMGRTLPAASLTYSTEETRPVEAWSSTSSSMSCIPMASGRGKPSVAKRPTSEISRGFDGGRPGSPISHSTTTVTAWNRGSRSGREYTPASRTISHRSTPASSASSRTTHSRSVSPHPSVPPGSAHSPTSNRRTRSHRPSRVRAAAAIPTTGRRRRCLATSFTRTRRLFGMRRRFTEWLFIAEDVPVIGRRSAE
jgi:hypothetical protein